MVVGHCGVYGVFPPAREPCVEDMGEVSAECCCCCCWVVW